MSLITRCQRFLEELAVPATVFCKKVELSTSSFYRWRNGKLNLSDATLERIDTYLSKYNF